VREALRELEAVGLVEVEPFKGTRVRRLSERDLREAFEARALCRALQVPAAAEAINEASLALHSLGIDGQSDPIATEWC